MALFFRLFWNNLTFPNGRVQCNFSAFQFALKILTVNFFAIGFSLGLFISVGKNSSGAVFDRTHQNYCAGPALCKKSSPPAPKKKAHWARNCPPLKVLILTSDSSKPSVDEKTAAVWHDADVSCRREAVLWFEGERVCARNVDGEKCQAAFIAG